MLHVRLRLGRGFWVYVLLTLCFPTGTFAQQPGPEFERLLRGGVEAIRSGLDLRPQGERVHAVRALPAFYDAEGPTPVWVHPEAGARRLAGLERAIAVSAQHGLRPEDYHRAALADLGARLSTRTLSVEELVDLEILASDAFLVLGSHLLQGRVDPETIRPEWVANRRSAALEDVLSEAVRSGRIESALLDLAPQQPRYRAMLDAAARLTAVARRGGWPRLEEGPRLELGVEEARVEALRGRLRASGDLSGDAAGGGRFDETLAEAVRAFQRRHGLEADGVVGPATLSALNVPVEGRIQQLETNLERWRWLPADLGRRHIEVNIAGFDVKVVESGEAVRTHRAIVGRKYRQTPMFSGQMTYLVLSPYWHVPPSIAAIDKLPVVRRDPSELARQRMTLLDQRTNGVVDPASVDWSAIDGPEFNRRYRLRQDPGPSNALGAVKFMFPNHFNVYLHDTPSRELFGRTARSFSSGCIRVENPLDLAEYLLADQPQWTRAAIEQAAASGEERSVRLTASVPVHLLYWTAWAEADGSIHFRDDLYRRDPVVRGALEARAPGP